MRSDNLLGSAMGALLTAFSIAGNLWRGDPHLLSAFPDLITLAVAPLFIYWALGRKRRQGLGKVALRRYGKRMATVGAAVFAVLFGGFGVLRLPGYSTMAELLVALAASVLLTFVATTLVGYITAELCSRLFAQAA